MKKILLTITAFLLLTAVHAETADTAAIDTTSVSYANVMYEQGKYAEAVQVYESLLAANGPSAVLYYNAGNCYYRQRQLGKSILYYERTLFLDPGNDDAAYNLELANRLTRDKIDAPPESLFHIWWRNYITITKTGTWSTVAIICMWLSLGAWAVYLLPAFRNLQRIGFFGAAITLLIGLLSIIGFFGRKAYDEQNTYAIVMSPSSIIKSEPTETSTNLALLHEGFKLQMISREENWTEVRMPDGVVGWIRNADHLPIDPFISGTR